MAEGLVSNESVSGLPFTLTCLAGQLSPAIFCLDCGLGGQTFDCASAIAATTIPTVNIATLKTCTGVYRFPQRKPTTIVVTLPPLRRIM